MGTEHRHQIQRGSVRGRYRTNGAGCRGECRGRREASSVDRIQERNRFPHLFHRKEPHRQRGQDRRGGQDGNRKGDIRGEGGQGRGRFGIDKYEEGRFEPGELKNRTGNLQSTTIEFRRRREEGRGRRQDRRRRLYGEKGRRQERRREEGKIKEIELEKRKNDAKKKM